MSWARDGSGGTISSRGLYEGDSFFDKYWNLPRFTTQTFACNRLQTNVKPYAPWNYQRYNGGLNDYYTNAYATFKKVKKNGGIYRILSTALPYTLLGQSGQCTVDYEYQMPDAASWPYVKIFFPSFRFLQVAVDGRAVDDVRPDQSGKICLVLFDPDSSVTSVRLSLLLSSGDEILLPVSSAGDHEYDATIPTYLPSGFVDVVARVEDAKGNNMELTASPAFSFGASTDPKNLDARLRLNSYALSNVDSITFAPGDTLRYILSYINVGSGHCPKRRTFLPHDLKLQTDRPCDMDDRLIGNERYHQCPDQSSFPRDATIPGHSGALLAATHMDVGRDGVSEGPQRSRRYAIDRHRCFGDGRDDP